ncbi:MAG: hypothetical protein JWM47_2597, partial [Acidimicrobiales bacterium]|nr:hypothetical protein [Acidimicrobiales bacterium]
MGHAGAMATPVAPLGRAAAVAARL